MQQEQEPSPARARNPFREVMTTELIDNADLYRNIFSTSILVGHARNVFERANVVVLGPMGCGKTMLLNLTRLQVLADWGKNSPSTWPKILSDLPPFFGISINLTRANFHRFGLRRVSAAVGRDPDPVFEVSAAEDFLAHYLFGQFAKGMSLLQSEDSQFARNWMGLPAPPDLNDLCPLTTATSWACWKGYYDGCRSWENVQEFSDKRLGHWREFLNMVADDFPPGFLQGRAQADVVLHSIGNFLRKASSKELSLFVYLDQYEEIGHLNKCHGRELQRLLNSLLKSRDPVVFYRIGARTYDWGQELRVQGSESQVESERDYRIVDLTELLRRKEYRKSYIFPGFALDVALRRLKRICEFECEERQFKEMFGLWTHEDEATRYFVRSRRKAKETIRRIPRRLEQRILALCGPDASPLELRLASAWVLQRCQRQEDQAKILHDMRDRPWKTKQWWRKERKEIALVQVSSHAFQQRYYYGWETLLCLAGGNITAFIQLCAEIWDVVAKRDGDPLSEHPIPVQDQTHAILKAAAAWLVNDRRNPGGAERYRAITRIGPGISNSIRNDLALSNPGHTGFSLPEQELDADDKGRRVADLLRTGVSYAVFEERRHKSKMKESSTRLKYYLHPMLCAHSEFNIPIRRVKEPYYTHVDVVHGWLFESKPVKFVSPLKERS